MSTDEESSEVSVTVSLPDTPEEGAEVTPEPIAVVVPPTGDNGIEGALIEQTIDTAVELAQLRARIDEVEQVAYRALGMAEDAAAVAVEVEEVAAVAVEVADNAAEDAADAEDEVEQVVDEIAPTSAKTHPLFRPFSEWRR